MRATWLSVGLTAVCLLLGNSDVDACGDKFLRLGRALKLSRTYAAVHSASILIYRPNSAATGEVKLPSMLKQAGHRFREVMQPEDLRDAVESGKFDIILADASVAASLSEQMKGIVSRPLMLPVFDRLTKQQRIDAKKQYGHFLMASSRAHEVLAEIDHIMDQKRQSASSNP